MCIYGKLVRTHSACYWANVSKVNSHDLHGDPGKQASPPYTGSEWREPSVHTTRASRGDASATLTLFFCGSSNAQLGQQPGSAHCYEHGTIPNIKTTCKVTSLFHFAGGRDTGAQRGDLLAHRPQKETPTWPSLRRCTPSHGPWAQAMSPRCQCSQ